MRFLCRPFSVPALLIQCILNVVIKLFFQVPLRPPPTCTTRAFYDDALFVLYVSTILLTFICSNTALSVHSRHIFWKEHFLKLLYGFFQAFAVVVYLHFCIGAGIGFVEDG